MSDDKRSDLTEETLTATSTVHLFGRSFTGLRLGELGSLPAALGDRKASLARIYGFSHQGSYMPMSVPAVLVVYGEGVDVSGQQPGAPHGVSGVSQGGAFAPGTTMWSMHELDFSARVDVRIGSVGEVLVNPELVAGGVVGDADVVSRSRLVGRAAMGMGG